LFEAGARWGTSPTAEIGDIRRSLLKTSDWTFVDAMKLLCKGRLLFLDDLVGPGEELKNSQIQVKSSQGVVELSGVVKSADLSTKAEKLAGGVTDVARVVNSIIVKP
jgi:hypothetical protein